MTIVRLLLVLSFLTVYPEFGRTDEPKMNRITVMKNRIMGLSVDGEPGAQHFADQPILRYSDPTRRITDASVWRLGASGRPRAVVVLEVYSGRNIQVEPTAVFDPPKQVKGKSWQWSPTSASLQWTPIPVDLDAAADRSQLQRIAKQLSRRFTASESFRGQTYKLRLMPKPLLEYVDTEQGVVAGVMFAWVHGTNVEALMLVESQEGKDQERTWVAGFSRLGAASLDVQFNNEPFWNAPAMTSTSSTGSYYYRMLSMTADERQAFSENE